MQSTAAERWRRRRKWLLAGFYALAALAVLAVWAGEPLLYRLGAIRPQTLSLADFTPVDVERIDSETLITTSDDSQLWLTGSGMHSLWVRCTFSDPPGEFVAFYQNRADAPFTARKAAYARQYGDWYVFALPAGTRKLRLDLGIFPSVTVHFDEIVLDRQPLPGRVGGTLVWAALLPGLLFAVLDWCLELWFTRGLAMRRAARLRRYQKKRKGNPMTVTKDTVIADILQNDPLRESVAIFLSAGMHCLGCAAAHGETVAQACEVHGTDPDALVAELNAYFAKLAG